MLSLSLPWPPSVNTIWRRNGSKYFISPKGVEFYACAKRAAIQAFGYDWQPLTEPIEVKIWLYPPSKRKYDIDNPLKAILDSLTKSGVIIDDIIVKRLYVEMMHPQPPGRVEIEIIPL